MKFNLDELCLPIQKKLLHSKKQYAGIVSSRSTGKTWILSWMIVVALMRGQRILIFSQTYSSLKQNLMGEIMNRFKDLVNKAIEEVNADRRYKMIINAVSVVDANPELNISDLVLERVDALYEAEPAQ